MFYKNKTRQKQLLRMESASFSVLTKQHSPSSFCHLKFHTQCHLDFLEMKQKVGLTQHTYRKLEIYVFQGETRYNGIILMLFYCIDNIRMFINATLRHLRFRFVYLFPLFSRNLQKRKFITLLYQKIWLYIDLLVFHHLPKQSVVQGTTFVLQKSADPRQILLSAISARTGVEEVCRYRLHHPSSLNGEKLCIQTFFFG